MASLTKKQLPNGKFKFRLLFMASGKRRTLYLGHVKESKANAIKARIEDLVTAAKLKYKPDEESQKWIQKADWSIVDKLEAWGLTDRISYILDQRRKDENPDDDGGADGSPSLLDFCQWYIRQRKSDLERSTICKITASLNQLCDYCRDHETVSTVADVDPTMAFRFQLHRMESKAEATVSKDIKIAKTAFSYGVKAGMIGANPFHGLKPGSDVNLDGQQEVSMIEYEKLINACPDSDWRAIVALARLGGLRCPSELAELRWSDVNWDARTIRITSPKTKRYGKPERTIPLFERLEQALSDHLELTGDHSEFVISKEYLRRRGTSLSTRFDKIRKASGVPKIVNPMRNLRLSAANDVCRLPGITPKNLVDWFGHDMKTALKHYHRTTQRDFDQALSVDPFANPCNVKSNASAAKNGQERQSTNTKTPVNKRSPEHDRAKSDPYGTQICPENTEETVAALESNAISDALPDELRLIQAFRQLSPDDQTRLLEIAESFKRTECR